MAVVLRLARQGSKKSPFYRIVACDSRSPRNGRFLEQIGTYDPKMNPEAVRLDQERLGHWLQNGATPSDTVRQILNRQRAVAGAGSKAAG
jgi:small subunit ribosomal protein S16